MEELERQQEELSAEDVEDIKDGLDYLQLVLGLSYGPDQTYYVDEVLEALQRCVVPGLDLPSLCTRYEVTEPKDIPLEQLRTELADLKRNTPYLMEKLSKEKKMPYRVEKVPYLMEKLPEEEEGLPYKEEKMPDLMDELVSDERRLIYEEKVEKMQEELHYLEGALEWSYEMEEKKEVSYEKNREGILKAIQACAIPGLDLQSLCRRYKVPAPDGISLEGLRTELSDLKRNLPDLMEKLYVRTYLEEWPYKEEKMPDLMEELSSKREELPYEEEDLS